MNAFRRRMKRSGRSGFSLTEVCLAMLVIAVGMITIFGLMTISLDSSKDATDDTQIAQFADGVFNGIRALVAGTNFTWDAIDNMDIPVGAIPMWKSAQAEVIKVTPGPDMNFKPIALRPATGIDAPDMLLRYELTYSDASSTRRVARLRVRPGGVFKDPSGNYKVAPNATTAGEVEFVTEIFRFGKPQ